MNVHTLTSFMLSLNILLWNVRGIMSSTVCLINLMKSSNCDIAIICEHKLKPQYLNYMSSIDTNYISVSKGDKLNTGYNCYHGKGCVSILYKKTLQFSINELYEINSDRIVGLELKNQTYGSLFVFGTYLPSDNVLDNYRHELNVLDELYTYYSIYGKVLIAGDLNASCLPKDIGRTNNMKSKALFEFVNRYHLLYACDRICQRSLFYFYT